MVEKPNIWAYSLKTVLKRPNKRQSPRQRGFFVSFDIFNHL